MKDKVNKKIDQIHLSNHTNGFLYVREQWNKGKLSYDEYEEWIVKWMFSLSLTDFHQFVVDMWEEEERRFCSVCNVPIRSGTLCMACIKNI